MEIDVGCRRGPLSETEKQTRRANQLCLYCGGAGHIIIHWPHRPKREENQVSNLQIFDSYSLVNLSKPRTPIDGSHSNSFEVLSQLDDLLNE
jgi:hypothetical protein